MRYQIRSRDFEGVVISSDDDEELIRKVMTHHIERKHLKDYVVVSTRERLCGFKFRIVWGLGIPFWPPRRQKCFSGVEIFGVGIQASWDYFSDADKVVYDPMGEYPVLASVQSLKKRRKP